MKWIKVFAKYAIGTFFTLFVGLITTPIITRLISTEEMGKYSMFITIGDLLATFLFLGMDQSYIRFYNHEKVQNRVYLLWRCIKLPLILTGIVAIILLLWYPSISTILIGEKSLVVTFVFILYVLGLIFERFGLLRLQMESKAGRYSLLNIIKKVCYLIMSIVLVFFIFGNSSWSLITGITLTEVILVGVTYCIEKGNWKVYKCSLNVSNRELLKYGLPFMFATTVSLIFYSTDKLMLKALSDYTQIGIYSGAQNIVNLLNQVQIVFATFWMPVAYEHFVSAPQDKKFFIKANKIISYCMLVAMIILLCLKDIIVLFLGKDYKDAVYVFPFLAFMPIMYTVSETTVMGINFMKKSNYHVWISVISACVNIIGNYFLIIHFGAKGAAISTGISYAIFFLLRTLFANHVYPVRYELGKYILGCLLVYILAIYASFLKVNARFILVSVVVLLLITIMYRDILKEGKGLLYMIFSKIKRK